MAVQDDPQYPAWEKALDRFRDALKNWEAKRTAVAWIDLQKAIADLDKISSELT